MNESSPTLTIHLAVHSVDGLLDVAGSPVAESRVHPDVVRAIWEEAKRLCPKTRTARFRIVLAAPAADAGRDEEVRAAVGAHFQRECAAAAKELRDVFRDGRVSLLVGLCVVALMFFAGEAILRLGDRRLFTILSESLIIIGWVTLWIPAEALLFAHFPVRRRRNLARALGEAEVSLVVRS